MSDLNEAGKVETRPDGSKVFVHGHRYPDNVQRVTQQYAPDGTLQSAQVEWSGFAGKVLDVTATFDRDGNLVGEEGFRAEGMTTPVKALLRPLPGAAGGAAEAQATPQATPSQATLSPAASQSDAAIQVPRLQNTPPQPAAPTVPAPRSAAPTDEHRLAEGLKKIYGEVKRS